MATARTRREEPFGRRVFRVFDALAGAGNPGFKRASWDIAAVHWEKERLSLARAAYSIAQEIFTLTHQGRPKWTLLVVKGYWSDVGAGTPIRNIRWSRQMKGRRATFSRGSKSRSA